MSNTKNTSWYDSSLQKQGRGPYRVPNYYAKSASASSAMHSSECNDAAQSNAANENMHSASDKIIKNMQNRTTPGQSPMQPGPGTPTRTPAPSIPKITTPPPGTPTPTPGPTTPPAMTLPPAPGTSSPTPGSSTPPGMPPMPGTSSPAPRTTTPPGMTMPPTGTVVPPGTTSLRGMVPTGYHAPYEMKTNQYPYRSMNMPSYQSRNNYQPLHTSYVYDYKTPSYPQYINPNNSPYVSPMGIPLLPIYGYDNSEDLDKDVERMKYLYPNTAKLIHPQVMEECDKLEYDGSMMFDEYPDKVSVNRIVERIYDKVSNMEEYSPIEATSCVGGDCGSRRNYFRELINILLLEEFFNRRRRHRSRKRWF